MRLFGSDKTTLIDPAEALPGREQQIAVPERHFVLGTPLKPPFPEGVRTAIFGMGCFWGAERIFWEADGVYTTAVGYAGGATPNPTYEEVCSARTGHAEVVLVAYDAAQDELRADAEAVLGGPRPDPGHAPGRRRRHAVPLADPLGRRRPEGRRRSVAGDVPGRALRGGLRHDHDRDSSRPTRPVLLRRGLPPAVPGEEPRRVLRARAGRA